MKNKLLPLLAAVIIIASAGFALYPTVSQWVNAMLSESAIMHYNETVDTLSFEDKEAELIKAEEYNRGLSNAVSDSFSSEAFEDDERYNSILNLTDDGQIGTVDIPSIDCQLPVYHGSNEEMLSKGAVHLVGTAFPIGGGSTRSVISAHTAYPGKILFDRLTEVEIGDEFSVTVLGKTLYYKVTEVNVILPEEAEYLMPEHLTRLKKRSLNRKRSLALREFALGMESLTRFVSKEPLYRVHECVFGVLAFESEPVDPRL